MKGHKERKMMDWKGGEPWTPHPNEADRQLQREQTVMKKLGRDIFESIFKDWVKEERLEVEQ